MNRPTWLKPEWKEAAIWALAAAIMLEGGCNVVAGETIWHRLTKLENHVQDLQHQRELEEVQTNMQLNELRQKAQTNAEQVEKVEEKVEKKKH